MKHALLRAAGLALGLAFLGTAPAVAQNVLATVNSQPITSFDVAQRVRIAALTERRRLDQRAALQELIDDQVKLIEARRVGYRVTEQGVEGEFDRLARANRQSPSDFATTLRRGGIEPTALRDKIRADLAFQVLQRDFARRGTQVSNEEIDKAVAEEEKKRKPIVDYLLQSVIFVVPTGGSAGERLRAANAARSRFADCQSGPDEMRQLPNVAVRAPTARSSDTLSAQLTGVLDKTPVGRLTQPFPSEQGIEMVAVCERKQRESAPSIRAEVAARLAEQRAASSIKEYIAELRKRVDIRFRR